MPKFLEDRLRAEAARKGFSPKQTARYIYGAMNNLGAMRGNQETAKGVRMDQKHAADVAAGKARSVKAPSPRQARAATMPSEKVTAPQTAANQPSESVPKAKKAKQFHPQTARLGKYAHPIGGY